jgi:hypothetical protein
MFDRILIFLAVVFSIFIVYVVSKRVPYEFINAFGLFFAMPPMVLMTIGGLVNWIIVGNTHFVWSLVPYAMIPSVICIVLITGKIFFSVAHHMIDPNYKFCKD